MNFLAGLIVIFTAITPLTFATLQNCCAASGAAGGAADDLAARVLEVEPQRAPDLQRMLHFPIRKIHLFH